MSGSFCPEGYEHDTWFVIPLHVEQGVGSNTCTSPIQGLYILQNVLTAILIVCFVLSILRGLQELVKAKKNINIFFLMVLSVISIPFMIAILQLRNKVSVGLNFSLFGISLIPFHTAILFAIKNVTETIPELFAIKITEGQKQLFTKDIMIRANIGICITCVVVIFVFFSILMPLQTDQHMILAYYRVGCVANAVTIVNYAVITWKSCSILIKIIDEVQKTVRSKSIRTGVPTPGLGSASEHKMEMARKKFVASQFEAVFGLAPCIMWLLQVSIVPFYWYLVIFHMFEIVSFYLAMFALYPIDFRFIFRAVCLKQNDQSSSKVSNNQNGDTETGTKVVGSVDLFQGDQSYQGSALSPIKSLHDAKIDVSHD